MYGKLKKIHGKTDEKLFTYRWTSNASRTLVGNRIVDHWDVIRAESVGAISITYTFST